MTTLVTSIVETIIKSSVMLAFTFPATLALRRPVCPRFGHTVWSVGLLCTLALPVFSLVMPAWYVKPARAVHDSKSDIAPPTAATESAPVSVPTTAAVPSAPRWLTPERVLLLVWMIGVLSVTSLLLREAIRFGASRSRGPAVVKQPSWQELAHEISQASRSETACAF